MGTLTFWVAPVSPLMSSTLGGPHGFDEHFLTYRTKGGGRKAGANNNKKKCTTVLYICTSFPTNKRLLSQSEDTATDTDPDSNYKR